jgi:hypothetical protein
MKIKYPEGALFVAQPVYDWMILDEFSIAAYWTENFREARAASMKLLQDGKCPPDQKERIEANLKFATEGVVNQSEVVLS